MAYFRATVLPGALLLSTPPPSTPLLGTLLLSTLGFVSLTACANDDPGVVAVANGAEEENEPETEADCTLGELRCDCRAEPEDECDGDLICLSGVCVEDDATGEDSESGPPAVEPDVPTPNPTAPVPVNTPTPPVEPETPPQPTVSEPEPMGASGSGPSGTGGTSANPTEAGGSGGTVVVPSGGSGGTVTGMAGNPGSAGMPSSTFDGGLIQNGDFANGDAFWKVDDGTGILVTHSTNGGSLCVQMGASLPYAYLGWPMEAAAGVILSAASYEFSYDAWSTSPGNIQFSAKVGESSTPYTAHFESPVTLNTVSQRYSHLVIPATATPSGVVFIVTAGLGDAQVCVDNVSLRAL